MADDIEERKEEEFEFNSDVDCIFGCELSARYSLLCRYWIYSSIVEDCVFLFSFFYFRWFFDGSAVLYNRWIIIWDLELVFLILGLSFANRYISDRYIIRKL